MSLTLQGVEAYVAKQVRFDEDIRKIFDACNRFGTIGNRDRESYRTWEEWGFSLDAIIAVAKTCSDSAFPFPMINRILAEMRSRNIFDEEGIKKALADRKTSAPKKNNDEYMKHEYSAEQLDNIIVSFDDWVE